MVLQLLDRHGVSRDFQRFAPDLTAAGAELVGLRRDQHAQHVLRASTDFQVPRIDVLDSVVGAMMSL